MTIWKHSECKYTFTGGQATPMTCPVGEIHQCSNPDAGFEIKCSQITPKVWECIACGWLVESDQKPETCPAGPSLEVCPNPGAGNFTKICD